MTTPIVMRALPLLFPFAFLAVGCRHAVISNEGRIASATRSGTYVAGVGKVAGGSEAIAWSPDGKTLAIQTDAGTLLWPGETTLPKLFAPMAWSPDGRSLAGWNGTKIVVENLENQAKRIPKWIFRATPSHLGWTSDGKLFAVSNEGELRIEGLEGAVRTKTEVDDVARDSDGGLVWLEGLHPQTGESLATTLSSPIRLVRWRPGKTPSIAARGKVGDLLTDSGAGRFSVPTVVALSPDGGRIAAGGFVVEGPPDVVSRLMKAAKGDDEKRLLKQVRSRAVVVLVEAEHRRELWSASLDLGEEDFGVESLSWSPDRRWLAVALANRTVRVRVESDSLLHPPAPSSSPVRIEKSFEHPSEATRRG